MVESRCGLVCSECTYREPCNCGGCIETNGHPFHGTCPVAVCCGEKKYDHCGQCPDMPCEQLYAYSYLDKEHGDNPPGARIENLKKWSKQHDSELISKAAAIMKAAETAVIALIDENYFPRASTISCLKTGGIKHAWFATGLSTGKARCIRLNNKAGLCFCDGNNNVTLMGTVEILTEPEIKQEMWVDWFINHFPGGTTDPEYCILRFTAESAVFWIDSEYKELHLNGII